MTQDEIEHRALKALLDIEAGLEGTKSDETEIDAIARVSGVPKGHVREALDKFGVSVIGGREIGMTQAVHDRIEAHVLHPITPAADTKPKKGAANSRKIFLVHGRDDGTKSAVARYLERLKLTPIILHEHANEGRTVIEKFEKHADDVAFAVVLLTPDDVGALAGPTARDELKPRARQNVVLELGYFMARLGRQNVCALVKGDVERPSDFDGVLYVSMTGDGWKLLLAREIKAAGISVDFNLID